MTDYVLIGGQQFEICPCCGKPKKPKQQAHPLPQCPVRRLGEQSGETGGHPGTYRREKPSGRAGNVYGDFGHPKQGKQLNTYTDTGTAARFFKQADWSYEIAERLALADPVRYQSKTSRKERDAGLEGMPLVEPGSTSNGGVGGRKMTVGGASLKGERVAPLPRRNIHPTVKPIALNIWLATLLLPPPEYAPRRLLVPFAGTGSEAIGALLAGWDEVVMVDNNAEYCDIAEARTRWWRGWSQQAGTTEPKEILKVAKRQSEPDNEQLELI
jgi:hypothetical protein